jgi:hypothetical protein
VKYAYPVKKMCHWLAVSASGFFDWKRRGMSATARRREELTALVVEIFTDSDETYGYRRVHAELGRRRIPAGLELVRSIMREQGLVPCQPRPWRASLTENDGSAGSIPDLVNRDFTADAPGEKMVGDITYIPTWEGWLYLATVIDCHTKKVVGYAMDDNYKTPLIVEAVRMAARNLTFAPDAIFHSDRGSNLRLNRSSQHLDREANCGTRARLGCGSDGQTADAVAGSPTGRSQGTAEIVLDGGRARSDECRCWARGRRVGGPRYSVVPRMWRGDTSIGFPCGLGPVSVVRRA